MGSGSGSGNGSGRGDGSSCCKPWCTPCWGTIAAVFGVGLIVAAAVVPPVIRSLVDTKMCDQLCVPTPRDPTASDYYEYGNWLTNDNETVNPPELFSYHFFNITNVHDVVNGAKPVMRVVGPYVYRQRRFKSFVQFSDQSDSPEFVSYEQGQSFTFQPQLSGEGLSPDDRLATINLPFLAGAWLLWLNAGVPMQPSSMMVNCPPQPGQPSECLIDFFTPSQHLFRRPSSTVALGNNIVFNPAYGFPANFIDPEFQVFINCTDAQSCHDAYSVRHYFGMSGACELKKNPFMPNEVWFCLAPNSTRIGNATTPHVNMSAIESTGRAGGGLQDLGALHAWMGNRTTSRMWNGTQQIRGGNNLQFQSGLARDGSTTPLTLWDTQSLRAFDFDFDSKQSILDIEVLRYRPNAAAFGGVDPAFYGPGIPGLINSSSQALTQLGVPAPVFGSRPFFAQSDVTVQQQLLSEFECLNCPADMSLETWDTFVDVEPVTGKVLRGSKKVQVSAQIAQPYIFNTTVPNQVQPYRFMRPNMLLPLFFFSYDAEANDGQANLVKDGLKQIKLARGAELGIEIGGYALGGALLVVAGYLFYRHCTRKSSDLSVNDYPTASGFQPLASGGY